MKQLLFTILAFCCLGFAQCTKPKKDFTFSINPEPFDNFVTVKFYDAAKPGNPPANITFTVSGGISNDVYEISGVKTYKVVDGIITLGIMPKAAPTQAKPATFNITATCPGYLPVNIPVKILAGQQMKLLSVSMINIANPPAGVNVKEINSALTGNATATDVTIETPAAAAGDQTMSVEIPAGTSFKDAAGNTITGTTLHSIVVNFGTNSVGSLNAFPGGGFASNSITGPNGNAVSGIFRTAGFCDILMDVSGTTVKTFSQPVTLHMSINSNQLNPATGALFQTGDVIPVWSYQSETGQWKYEQQGTITDNAGMKEVAFSTNHLTYFNLAVLNDVCELSNINFTTNLASAESFLIDIYAANDPNIPLLNGYIMQVANNNNVSFSNVPQGNVVFKVYKNNANNSQTNWHIRDAAPLAIYTGSLCGTTPDINIIVPVSTPVTFNIQGKCPNSSANPIVKPSVDIWYRLANAPTEYQLLGHVSQGIFETTNLNFLSTYDFKVIWGGNRVYLKTKTVDSLSYHRTITVPAAQEAYFCN